jgi:hypothetical protein
MRLEGWETRLAQTVEAARAREYVLGTHDCFTFAGQCVAALTGTDPTAPWHGKYRSQIDAFRLMREYAGGGFAEAFNRLFNQYPHAALLARRGDVVHFQDDRGGHLGVCVGGQVAVLLDTGLAFVPITHPGCVGCWRID